MNVSDKKIIDSWLEEYQSKKELPIDSLINLLDKLHYDKYKKLSKAKIISNNTKNIVQIYTNDFSKYFYKKQLNSNWTYLQYPEFNKEIK